MKIHQSSMLRTIVGLALIWCAPIPYANANDTQEKHILGWIEKVEILPENFSLSAKIDTGADHSSLNVSNPTHFMKGQEKWIRFSIAVKEKETVTLADH